jgi:hypothetical protein
MDMKHHYYDWNAGWEGTNPGWHEVIVRYSNPKKHARCVEWLYTNIDKPERHARWVGLFGKSAFKFRYERDYIWFRLTWE